MKTEETKNLTIVEKKRISPQKQVIIDNIDQILDMIASNISYTEIAKRFNVSQAYICDILSLPEYCARKELALQTASYKQIEEAEQYLLSIDPDDSHASVRKKCELSQFKTYLAKVKNRKEFDLNYKSQENNNNQQVIVLPANFQQELLQKNKNEQ